VSVIHPDDVDLTREEYIEHLKGLIERLKEKGATSKEIGILYGSELIKMGVAF